MANILPRPSNLTKSDILKLMDACEKFYPIELLGEGYRGYSVTRWEIPELKYKWENSRSFFKDITSLTGQEDIKSVYETLVEWEKEASKVLSSEEKLSQTTPGKERLEQLEKEAAEREKIRTEAQKKAIKETREQIIYLESLKKPKPITFDQKEKEVVEKLIEAAQRNPDKFIENFTEKISDPNNLPLEVSEKIPTENIKEVAPFIARDFATKLRGLGTQAAAGKSLDIIQPPQNQVWLLSTLSDPNIVSVSKPIQTLASAKAVFNDAAGQLISSQYGSKLFYALYGNPEEEKYKIVDKSSESSIRINLKELIKVAEQIEQETQKRQEKINTNSDAAFDYTRIDWQNIVGNFPLRQVGNVFSNVFSSMFPPPLPLITTTAGAYAGYQLISPMLFSAWQAQALLTAPYALLQSGAASTAVIPQITTTYAILDASGTIISSGLATVIPASEAGAAVIGAGTQATLTTAAAGAGATAGNIVVPIIGAVIGAVIGYLSSKVIPFIQRNFNKVLIGIGTALFGLGFLLASTPIMLGGLGTAGAGLIGAAGGVGPALSAAGGFTAGAIGAVGAMVVSSLVVPLVATLIGVPIVVALIIFIINSGAYIVPPGPTLEVPSFAGTGAKITCTKEKGAVSFGNTSSNPIAKRAWEITADLYQGFWCYWNRSPGDFPDDTASYPPSYPETFDENLFTKNPNPSPAEMSKCGDCLFWCTYLVQKAFRESGNTSLLVTLWSPTMQDDFTKRGKFIANRDSTPKNVVPGSVIFFKIEPGPDRTNHVAIVYSVNEDGISYVQSNAPTKDDFVPFNSSGKGIQNPPGIGVVGIGLP